MSAHARAAVLREFQSRFGAPPTWLARAPGRVNLIGEHTDYNDGFVLPMAIDRAVWLALRPRTDRAVSLYSLDFHEQQEFRLGDPVTPGDNWLRYIEAMASSLLDAGYELRGWEGVTIGDVPIGAGLSSSAAIELAAARAFGAAAGFSWDARKMALLAQRAENVWVGVNCGIMDQMISASGETGCALLIDCRDLNTRAVPLPPDAAVVILDTATRRGLVDSEYNERRQNCEAAARILGVKALRDIDTARLARRAQELDPVMRKRARHVVTENERTLRAVEVLRAGDAEAMGELMKASHASLRDDFEVSRAELDTIVDLANAESACFGARMTGAGFGGCAVALVDAEHSEVFVESVSEAYQAATGLQPALYVCSPAAGASLESAASLGSDDDHAIGPAHSVDRG